MKVKHVKQLPDNLWSPLQGTLRQPSAFNPLDAAAVLISLCSAVGITILNWA